MVAKGQAIFVRHRKGSGLNPHYSDQFFAIKAGDDKILLCVQIYSGYFRYSGYVTELRKFNKGKISFGGREWLSVIFN